MPHDRRVPLDVHDLPVRVQRFALPVLRVVEPVTCKHACGYAGTPDDLSTHERAEHSRCHQCGSDPVGTAPVAHLTTCQRYTQTGGRL